MAERMVQVPVSLIQRARDAIDAPTTWTTDIRADLTALLSQPTPSAEPRTLFDQVLAEHKRTDGDEGDGYTSPREHWIQCSCGTLLYIQMQGSGSWCPDNDLDDFEDVWALHVLTAAISSTIRDVTPPKEQP